jgi:hypothetical protein
MVPVPLSDQSNMAGRYTGSFKYLYVFCISIRIWPLSGSGPNPSSGSTKYLIEDDSAGHVELLGILLQLPLLGRAPQIFQPEKNHVKPSTVTREGGEWK